MVSVRRIIVNRVLPVVAMAAAVGLVLFLGRNPQALPSSLTDDTVVATLGSASTPYPPELRAAAARVREAPGDRAAALDAARRYMDYGRAIGDARFAGAALGVLQPFLNGQSDPGVLNLAASARQYMHDFTGAIDLLDAALGVDPGNAQALLSRANIHIVQGRFGPASADCVALANARRVDLAILCDTTARALGVDSPAAHQRLEDLVASGGIDPALGGYAHSLLAEIARFQLWPDKARAAFEAALRDSPDDLRTRMIFADFELAQGRAEPALALLEGSPPTDSIMVRQAIAHKALGRSAEVKRLSGVLRARIDAAAVSGEVAHAREAARFWIEVEPDADAALVAAQTNWASQRELEDAMLLLAASAMAAKPEAADPVRQWAEEEGVVAPMYLEAAARATRPPS